MQYCHEQLKQLTTKLTEENEELLKLENRVDSLQADQLEAREVSRGRLLVVMNCCCGGVLLLIFSP